MFNILKGVAYLVAGVVMAKVAEELDKKARQ
jgi:hypothetical protein